MSGIISKWDGQGGQLKVPGLGAVLATISNWTLLRREDSRREGLVWDLHGVLSYVNDTLLQALHDNGYPLRIAISFKERDRTITFDMANLDITGNRLIVKEITLDD